MSAALWASSRSGKERALKRLARMPESSTGHGVAVPFPFADRKAYEDHFSSKEINARIMRAPIRDIPLGRIHAIQHSVKPDRVRQYIDDPDLRPPGDLHPKAGTPVDHPIAIKYRDELYLHDGHHRGTAAFLMGKDSIPGRWVDLDEGASSSEAA